MLAKKPLEPETPRTAVEQSMANVEKEVEEKGKKDRKPSSNKKSGVAKKKDSVPDLNASTGSQQVSSSFYISQPHALFKKKLR